MKKNANIFSKLFDDRHRSRTVSYLLVLAVYLVLELMMKGGKLSSLFKSLLVPACCYIVAAIGLNLNVGFSGELNLGQAGFMSVGAFTGICISGYLASSVTNPVIRLLIAIVCGALLAAVMGWLIGIPVLKLQGDYLAIVTLAFGQIIKSLITNLYFGFDENGFHLSFVDNNVKLAPGGKMLINGPIGATGTQRIATFTMGVILVMTALAIVYNLIYSKSGRAIMACRDNRIAAESIGIKVADTKMLAFVISASLAGAAGALYGLNYATLAAAKFDFNTSILILVFVVLGGLGNMTGTIISTSLLLILPEMLRGLKDYRMLIYAVVLIVIMLVSNNSFLRAKFSAFTKKLRRGKEAAGHD